MKIKKVLFISPTPIHPTNAGNRQHIKSLVSFFKEQNWEAHFLYLAYEDYDEVEMQSFLGNSSYIIPKDFIFQNKKTPDYIYRKLLSILSRIKRDIQFRTGTITKEQFLYNSEVDNYFSVFVKPVIKSLRDKYHFDVVVCEYAFISKCLTYFDQSVLKILDTHDRFSDRFKVYLKNNLHPSWVSLFKSQERKALKRADLILAVHERDADYFSKLSARTSVVFNHIPEVIDLPKKPSGKKLLYVASANDINVSTIKGFIDSTFSLILNLHPDATLIIGGKICEKLKINHDNILLKGKFDDLSSFYSLGDIVINPEKNGTGYKVKAMEALSYGMPLVATSAGAIGVSIPFNDHLFIADSPEGFVKIIDTLFKDVELLKATSIKAHNWVSSYKEKMKTELLSQLNISGSNS